jgi:hypothetical protein
VSAGYPDPRRGDATDIVLPQRLSGPFVQELHPVERYRHRSSQLAAVVYYRNRGHSVITLQESTHHRRPWLLRTPYAVTLLARGRHQSSFELPLPAAGDKDNFATAVDVNWEVSDYLRAGETRLVDVALMLKPKVQDRLRTISRQFDLAQAEKADRAIKAELRNEEWQSIGAEYGVWTEVFVRIDLGRAARAIEDARTEQAVEGARDEARRERVRANMAEARLYVLGGEAEQFAYMWAQDPARAAEVLTAIQTLVKERRENAVEFLKKLLDDGVVQRHQLDEPIQRLLRAAVDGRLAPAPIAVEDGLPVMPTLLDEPLGRTWLDRGPGVA